MKCQTNVLDIDPDKIFQEKSIEDIEDVQKKIQDEVERKKEELRTMVGERYRDLIKAADTISEMQITATGVINRICAMEELCGAFQQRQLLGFQLDLSKSSSSTFEKHDSSGLALAVQVKILVLIPEQIWIAIEKEDFLLGTQLFLLARHIETGFRLESSPLLDEMMPVVIRQWASISHFKDKLVDGALKALTTPDLSNLSAAQCLCVIALLNSMNGESLLDSFLQLRRTSLSSILLGGDDKANVKHRVSSSLHLLLNTLSLLHSCFVEARGGVQEGLIWQHLHALTQSDVSFGSPHSTRVSSTAELLDSLGLEPSSLRLLPPVVRDFKPSNKYCKDCISLEVVQSNTTKWLHLLYVFLSDALNSLFDLVTSIRALQSIRDSSLNEQQALSGWDIALQKLKLPCGLDVWGAYYQPLLSRRVCVLVEQQWTSALATTRQKLADQLRAILRDRSIQPEHDLRWFVWRERLSDLPQQSVETNSPSSCGLLLKCQGFSPRVETLCQSLDQPLSLLLQDILSYVQNSDVDRNEVQQHLQLCSSSHLHELCQHIKENCLAGASGREEACVALIARFLGALCDLSPALKSCFLPFALISSSKVKSVLGSSAVWTDIVKVLEKSSTEAWSTWQKIVSSHFEILVQDRLLPEPGNLSALLSHSTPQWEEHNMEEQGEEGGQLCSVIRVPAQPSLALQHILSEACHVIGAAQPHTIPSDVKVAFVDKLVSDILEQYFNTVKTDLPQAQALQFLLDIMFLSSALIPRSQKPLSQQVQKVCTLLEEKIDPFDLDVFSPYIQTNVRQSVRHMQCLLGVLISCWPEKLSSMWTTSCSTDKGSEQPSMLAICPAVPWFPLLPVLPSSSTSVQLPAMPEKPQAKHSTDNRSPKKRTEPMENIKSGAAAFFGAMSSDWFS